MLTHDETAADSDVSTLAEPSRGPARPPLLSQRPEAQAQQALQRQIDDSPRVRQLRSQFPQPLIRASTPTAAAPVQRQIDHAQPGLDPALRDLAADYNTLDDHTTLTTRIARLAAVERAVYDWFAAHPAPDLNATPAAAPVQQLMNAVRAERQRVVDRSVLVDQDQNQDAGALPIAGFETLTAEMQQEIRGIWRNLIAGNAGNIRITQTEDAGTDTERVHAGFQQKVLVEFSRLLESEFGRGLVRTINAGAHQVVIEPFFHADDRGKSFAASPTDNDGRDNLVELADAPAADQLAHYPDVVLTGRSKAERLQAVNRLNHNPPDGQLGVRLVDDASSRYYQFGAGGAVKVTMPADFADSTQENESRLMSTGRNELVAPQFVTLGHELGHATHIQRGTATQQAISVAGFIGPAADLDDYLGNREEYINIEGNENPLRAGYGLGARKGHINQPYELKERMLAQLDAWRTWYAGLTPDEHRRADGPRLVAKINRVETFVNTQWATPTGLRKAQQQFAGVTSVVTAAQQILANQPAVAL